MLAQFGLRISETVNHPVAGLQGLDEHPVLDSLRQQTLHLAVAVAHAPCVLTHLCHVYTADGNKHRQDSHGDTGQPHIHLHQVEEGTDKECHCRQRRGQRLGDESHHRLHILFQTVDDVAAVVTVLAAPLGTEQTVEHLLLHTVLSLHTEDILQPHL